MRDPGVSLEDVQHRVREQVAKRLGIEESVIAPWSHFVDDLGADSLDVVELVMAVEEEFGVEIDLD
ncbi:MAG TPA: acyl carrier protein [Candidatus Sulfotelmatobacter sp.]|jgi:acyl carrier protein|nr:acyl carrier protein [Candidatus Sulfotelmatobacter sp.]